MTKKMLTGVAFGALMAASVPASAEIVIGAAGPMTGQYASFGEQFRLGAEMAVEQINAAGGVNGEMLRLVIGDDACDPRQAVNVANQFVGEGVVFVAGHFCSGSSIPASAVYSEEGIIQISPASTNPAFTDERPGPGIYRVCGRDDKQGVVAGSYLAENFPEGNVAILHDRTAYGQGLAEETRNAMTAAGVEPTMFEAYTPGERDYSALVSRLNAEGIGAVYIGGYHTEAGLILRQMREQGLEAQMVSGDALVTDEFWSITGDLGNGVMMTFSPDPRKYESAAEVVAAFEEKGVNPEGYVLYTYAAIQAWADAVEAAGSTDFDAVVSALDENTFDTVLGQIDFNEVGDPTEANYVWYVWEDGTYREM
ncbi:branched-chain amino acid ABC transporter substrate-binding protein [Salinarimonas ramus]|uniref:Branched chain amino acid ABC transporter substrate-binding protein n=1 Tax=Salinarimonas ramus TaxID=690164 RepID=A0A917QHY7_9HYPH|nr:branched-chain amino acid ABC transporter substrate-binding protein [Salinarimonas ramus]GGK49907.1 branched chain amino acid ABC transporter substrate-binding protein [Salinarimonas ramus]